MKTTIILSAVLGLTLFASGCGSDSTSGNADSSYTYHYEENGCDTGTHSFNSHDAYCAGLKDDALNNGCAYDLRASAYQSNCT